MGIKPELSVCPYCGRPFERRYLYTTGGPGLFLSRGRRVSWPALLPPTVNVLRENNPGLEILAGPFMVELSISSVPVLYCPDCKSAVFQTLIDPSVEEPYGVKEDLQQWGVSIVQALKRKWNESWNGSEDSE